MKILEADRRLILMHFVKQSKSILTHPSLYFFRHFLQRLGCNNLPSSACAGDISLSLLKELKLFIKQCKSTPSTLTDPSLSFFRDYLQSLGCNLPSTAYKVGDNKRMGDPSNEVSEEILNAIQESKAQKMETISEDIANLGKTPLWEPKSKMKNISEGEKISQLPDEVLVSILSLLPTKESVRTCILAKRWQDLWKAVQHVDLIVGSKFTNFSFLTKSTIHNQNLMNKSNIEHILSICHFLEEFRLIGSTVVDLTISVKSLKKLEIFGCYNMCKLELFAPNLVSLKYNGPDIEFIFGDVPRLVEVSFVESYCLSLVNREFEQFEPILEQIVRVNLIMDFPWMSGSPLVFGLQYLKELRLDIRIWDTEKPLTLFWSLLVSFPFLDVFLLHLFWPENHKVMDIDLGDVQFDDVGPQTYTFKVFEIDGCISSNLELGFVKYVLERSDILEELVVRVARRASVESEEDLMDLQERKDAMKKAREYIAPMVSEGTTFVLL